MFDKKAYFGEVYQANYQKVFRICMGYVSGNEEVAKDLTQDVFIKVWDCLDSFRKESSISTWIYRIAVNTCLLQFRGKKFTKTDKPLERITAIEEQECDASKEERLQRMYHCIDRLPKENKGMLLLALEGLPQKEIAAIVGLSHEAVRVRLHRIKNNLIKCVQHESI